MDDVTDQANDAVANALWIGFIFLAQIQFFEVIPHFRAKHFFARESVPVCGTAPPCKVKFVPTYTRKRWSISRRRRVAIGSFQVSALNHHQLQMPSPS